MAEPKQAPVADDAVATIHANNTAGSDGGASYERIPDATAEAVQRAAILDHQIRADPKGWARLGNGAAVRINPGMPFKYPGDETHEMMDHPGGIWKIVDGRWYLMRNANNEPTTILLNPKPPFYFGGVPSHRYAWFVRTPAVKDDLRPSATAALHRQQKIRYIETHEIDPSSPIAIFEEHATANNTYVTSGTSILAEIMDPRLSYQKYKGWDDMAIQRVMTVADTVQASPSVMTDAGPLATHIEGKTATTVKGPQDVSRGG